jgi:hypothetical protein
MAGLAWSDCIKKYDKTIGLAWCELVGKYEATIGLSRAFAAW